MFWLIKHVATTCAVQKTFESLIEESCNKTIDFERTDIITFILVPLFYSKENYGDLIKNIAIIYFVLHYNGVKLWNSF